MHLSSCGTAKCQPGGELRAEVQSEHAIACVFVCRHRTTRDEVLDPIVARTLTTIERVGGRGISRHLRWMDKSKGRV